MATSGTYVFTNTARAIIKHAMSELGIIPPGVEPEASELTSGILNLNGMLKSWQIEDGVWREETVEVAALADSETVDLDDAVRAVTSVRLLVNATYERPMNPWTRADYLQIPNKFTSGNPLNYYFRQQRGSAQLYLWPVPSTDVTLKVDYVRGIETVTDAAQTLDVPDDWFDAVWTNLAVRIAPGYGDAATLTPMLVARAEALYQALLDDARPESYFMGPWDDRYYG